MKRLSILLVGLLSAVLVFSVVGFADTEGTADATLNIDDVIDIDVSVTNNSAEITQDDSGTTLQSWNNSNGDNSVTDISIGSFTIDLITLSAYSISINTYSETWTDGNGNNKTMTENTDALDIQCSSSSEGTCSNNSWTAPGENLALDLSDDFAGSNNITSSGEQVIYDMQIDSSDLTLDFESGDEMQYQIGITVTEENV